MVPQKNICAVILTHNRTEACVRTVIRTAHALHGLNSAILLINNGTGQITLPDIRTDTEVRIINNTENLGTSARNQALDQAEFLLMLDDDALIRPESIRSAVNLLERDPRSAAAAFRIQGSEGNEEACLLPTVFHGCACLFRTSALRETGGYPEWKSYYGEEYHVAFNLYNAGYRICMLTGEDNVLHMRHPAGRDISRIIRLNILHNASLWASRFPRRYLQPAIHDTILRYSLVARKEKADAVNASILPAVAWAVCRGLSNRKPLSLPLFRHIILLDRINKLCGIAHSHGIRSSVLAGTGKFPSMYIDEIRRRGIELKAIVDTNHCWKNSSISGIPVLTASSEDEAAGILARLKPESIMTGTASIPESLFWQKISLQGDMFSVWQDGWARYAGTGTIDLLENQPIALLASVETDVTDCCPCTYNTFAA